MGNPKVSILVTFYNQEKYVDKALQSIFEQNTEFEYKVLVGDDGSSDNTCENVRKWIDKYPGRIELYIMEREAGKYVSGFRASRNRINLLQYVRSEYFIFLDGDDFFDYPQKLQRQVDILDDPVNKDCIACGHNIDMLFPDGVRKQVMPATVKEGKYNAKQYWNGMYFHTDTLLTRASVIPSIPLKLLENNFNDNLITYTFIQKGSIYYIPESWAVYLQTGDGIWTSGKVINNLIRNMFLYDLCIQINPSMKKETSHRFADTWLELLRIRKQIYASELKDFSMEAQDKHMNNAYKWIHYSELSLLEKQQLCAIAVGKNMKRIITSGVRRASKLLKRG